MPTLWGARAQEPVPGQRKVVKTDEQWSKLLTREQFMVTRRKATEPAFSNKYWNNHAKGIYACVCCGLYTGWHQAEYFDADSRLIPFTELLRIVALATTHSSQQESYGTAMV